MERRVVAEIGVGIAFVLALGYAVFLLLDGMHRTELFYVPGVFAAAALGLLVRSLYRARGSVAAIVPWTLVALLSVALVWLAYRQIPPLPEMESLFERIYSEGRVQTLATHGALTVVGGTRRAPMEFGTGRQPPGDVHELIIRRGEVTIFISDDPEPSIEYGASDGSVFSFLGRGEDDGPRHLSVTPDSGPNEGGRLMDEDFDGVYETMIPAESYRFGTEQ